MDKAEKRNTMKPIGKYILIKEIKEEVKTESGLLLSAEDTSNIRYKKGKVIAPGTDVNVIDSDNIIFYDSRAGYTMIIEEEQFTVISEKDVVVVL